MHYTGTHGLAQTTVDTIKTVDLLARIHRYGVLVDLQVTTQAAFFAAPMWGGFEFKGLDELLEQGGAS